MTLRGRHRALDLVLEVWPELDEDPPPPRAVLAELLARAGASWTLIDPRDATAGYEAAVVAGRIPTRERSWHDAFNCLAFCWFPRTKAALHARCLALQRARERRPPRSREEDALTLIDETALLFAGGPESIAELERARADRDLAAIDQIVRERSISVHVLGHALHEHLVLARPVIGAGVITVALAGPATPARVDQALAERIAAGGFPVPRLAPTVPWPDPIVESWLTVIRPD